MPHRILLNHIDFIGINFYTRIVIGLNIRQKLLVNLNPNFLDNKSLNFLQDPSDLFLIVKRLSRFNKPIIITENGVPTSDDKLRQIYLKGIFQSLAKLLADKVNIMGYYHWSLIDNFEWGYGFKVKFGLYEFDKTTYLRYPKESSKVYKSLIANARENVLSNPTRLANL